MKNTLDVPVRIQQEPDHKAARHVAAKMIRNAPNEVLDPEDTLQEDLLLNARSKHVFFLLDGDVDDETSEVAGSLNIVLDAPFSNGLGRMLTPKEEVEQPDLADGALYAEVGAEWTEHILSKLTPEQRVSAIRHAYSARMLLLRETSESAGPDCLPEIRRRIDTIARHCVSAVARATAEEAEEEGAWPPGKPPSRVEIIETWELLHPLLQEYLKRKFTAPEQHALIDSIGPDHVSARFLTAEQHAETIADEVMPLRDLRPFRDEPLGSGELEGIGTSDEDGDTAQGEEKYRADTEFVLSLSLVCEAHSIAGKMASSLFGRGIARVTPDEALYIVSSLPREHRKIIADAVLWQFIDEEVDGQFMEEQGDGGIAPSWRARSMDPALDPLIICTHLQNLYARMTKDDRATEDFPDAPNAPKEPENRNKSS